MFNFHSLSIYIRIGPIKTLITMNGMYSTFLWSLTVEYFHLYLDALRWECSFYHRWCNLFWEEENSNYKYIYCFTRIDILREDFKVSRDKTVGYKKKTSKKRKPNIVICIYIYIYIMMALWDSNDTFDLLLIKCLIYVLTMTW